jgi:N utilization substance protein A
VDVHPEERRAVVWVPDSQLSLAIGKEGQNARLAAKLTGWRVDIKKQSETAVKQEQPEPAPIVVEEVVEDEGPVTMAELLGDVPIEAGEET